MLGPQQGLSVRSVSPSIHLIEAELTRGITGCLFDRLSFLFNNISNIPDITLLGNVVFGDRYDCSQADHFYIPRRTKAVI